jgi:hypothetical protein
MATRHANLCDVIVLHDGCHMTTTIDLGEIAMSELAWLMDAVNAVDDVAQKQRSKEMTTAFREATARFDLSNDQRANSACLDQPHLLEWIKSFAGYWLHFDSDHTYLLKSSQFSLGILLTGKAMTTRSMS